MRRSAPRRPGRGAGGFTLVELLVAATVAVMIATAAVMMLTGVSSARQRVDRQREIQQQARTAVAAVASALRNAHRPIDRDEALLEGLDDWMGELPRDRVRLWSVSRRTIRAGQPESDVREVELFVLDPQTGESPALMRRVDPTRNVEPDGGGVLERVADDVVGLNLSYHDGVQWRDQWTSETDGWPVAVKVELIVDPGAYEAGAMQDPVLVSRLINFPGLDDETDEATDTDDAQEDETQDDNGAGRGGGFGPERGGRS